MKFIETIKRALAYYGYGKVVHAPDVPRELCPNCKGFGYRYDRTLMPWDVFCERCDGTGHSPIIKIENVEHAASEGV